MESNGCRRRSRSRDRYRSEWRVSLFNLAGERLWTGGFHFSAFVYDVYCVAFQLKPGYDCDLLRGGRIIKRIGQLSDFVETGSVACFTVLWRLLDHSQSISFRQRKKKLCWYFFVWSALRLGQLRTLESSGRCTAWVC